MSSIIQGFEYDIFISYRQKDNKGDRWVSEFVEALKTELESTFKEEISVYFDINPHDGLLETHDVDASLKEKLKCLVFIPIISRTYCDPKSFAWEHEFKAFAEQASQDQFGLMVKLPNGNVASRVLPVRIHDITECDVKLFETITGNFLRGVEFIYKEPGVNRPLRFNEENPNANLNHTFYRNQINKVANAIQEVILAIKQPGQRAETFSKGESYHKPVSGHKKRLKLIAGVFFAIALIAVGMLYSQKLFKTDTKVEKSIAVLPIYSMSTDTVNQYIADGMMDAILTHLSKITEIRVMSRTSVEQYRKTKKTISEIGKELGVEYILEGSFQKSGDSIRLIAQLISTGKDGHVWSNIYDRLWNNVFAVQSEVANKIASELKGVLTPEEIKKMAENPTDNMDAYQAFLRGRYYAGQPHFSVEPWKLALDAFQEAVNLDSTFALAYGELARCHARLIYMKTDMSEERMKLANEAASRALELGSDNPRVHIALGYYYLYAHRDRSNALKHLETAEKNLPNDYDVLLQKAEIIGIQGRWYENIELLEKAKQISPNTIKVLTELAESYWLTHQYEKCFAASNQSNALNPNDNWPYLYKIFATWSSTGSPTGTGELVKHVSKKSEWYVWIQFWQFFGEKNFNNALQFLKDTTGNWSVINKVWAYPRPMLMALAYEQLGDSEQAGINYKAAMEILEKRTADVPIDPRYHSSLGLTYAGLGRKEDAIREGLKAVELLPISIDALYGIACVEDLALIYIKVGEYDLALEQIEKLFSVPSWVTPAWLNFDCRFKPLISHPKYKKILRKFSAGN